MNTYAISFVRENNVHSYTMIDAETEHEAVDKFMNNSVAGTKITNVSLWKPVPLYTINNSPLYTINESVEDTEEYIPVPVEEKIPSETEAWKIYDFITDWKNGKFGIKPLSECLTENYLSYKK